MYKLRDKIPFKPQEDFLVSSFNKDLKEDLRNDFNKCCAYCNDHDAYAGGKDNYHIEHFVPKSKFSEYKNKYSNLLYSCPYCNRAKSNKWVTDDPAVSHNDVDGFVNPCSDDYDKHLARDLSGKIMALTSVGQYMYKEMKLYLRRHQINFLLNKVIQQRKIIHKAIDEDNLDVERTVIFKKILIQLNQIFVSVFEEIYYD